MAKNPPLTDEQRRVLADLEPKLRSCVKTADFRTAVQITAQLQALLRPTGHETRLLQDKNWLFETAMEAGRLEFAESGFRGTLQKSSSSTRLHLEAIALLSVCLIRKKDIDAAAIMIGRTVELVSNIQSVNRRKQFHQRFVRRLEEESILAGLSQQHEKELDLEHVDSETQLLIKTKTETEILLELGRSIPPNSIDFLAKVQQGYQRRLPAPDRLLLPSPILEQPTVELGKRANAALKRVVWRSICDPTSEIYKAWSGGLSIVYDKKYITGAIVASLNSLSITGIMLAATAAALAIKAGAEIFCELYAPQSIMIDRRDRD